MKLFLLQLLSRAIASLAIFVSGNLAAEKLPDSWQNQSSELKKAVSVYAEVESNQLASTLEGITTGHLDIRIQIETLGKFKMYEDKTGFRVLNSSMWNMELVEAPATIKFLDPISGTFKPGYSGQSVFKFKLALRHPESKPLPLDYKLPVVASFQVCSDKVCLFPSEVLIEVPLVVSASPSKSKFSFEALTKALEGGNFGFQTFLILFLAGLLTAFTPCVYPLYPITLGIFSRWSQSPGLKINPFLLVLTYSGGIILSYSSLGLVTAASGVVFGSITQNVYFLLGTGFLIFFSSLVFSGWITLPLFDFLQNIFSSKKTLEPNSQNQFSFFGKAFSMGAGLGLVASPCVGPVLIALLAWLTPQLSSSSFSTYALGFVLLATFGFGMSLPIFVLGHLSFRLKKFPKLGVYAPFIKNLGTVLMMLASLYFLVPGFEILTRGSNSKKAHLNSQSFEEWNGIGPAIIDFRADWCAACIDLENKTFSSVKVQEFISKHNWQFVVSDLTLNDDRSKKIATHFKILGLPTVLIINSQNKICENLSLFGFENDTEFEKRLNKSFTECAGVTFSKPN